MTLYVPDASIILKWVIGEEGGREGAQALLSGWIEQRHDFLLPSLWRYEVANVLGLKRPKEADAILGLLLDYHFDELAVSAEVNRVAFGLMQAARGITFYDACYHAVAIVHKGTMITADKRYFTQTNDRDHIQLLRSGA